MAATLDFRELSPLANGSSARLWALELVHTVERRHFVSFGERRVIEYRVAEILHSAAEIQHGLADVNDFRGALADGVDAEQLLRIAVEEQLEHAALIAEHHALRELVVFRDANLVRRLARGERLFRFANHRNLGNRVNAKRKKFRHVFCGNAEHVAARESSLFHRCAGERGETDDVSRGVNVRHVRLVVLVHGELAARIHAQAGIFRGDLVAVGLPAHSVEQRVALHFFAAFEFRENAVAIRVDTDSRHFLAEAEDRIVLPQVIFERSHDFAIDEVEQRGTLVDQRDLAAERREKGCVFVTHHAGADDDHITRKTVHAGEPVGIHDAFVIKRNICAARRTRAARDQNVVRAQRHFFRFADHLHRVRIDEFRRALIHLNAIALELRADHFRFARNRCAHAEGEVLHGDIVFAAIVVAVEGFHGAAGELENCFADGFAGNRASVNADAADHRGAVNDRDFLADLRRGDRALLPRRAAANYDQVKLSLTHQVTRSNIFWIQPLLSRARMAIARRESSHVPGSSHGRGELSDRAIVYRHLYCNVNNPSILKIAAARQDSTDLSARRYRTWKR